MNTYACGQVAARLGTSRKRVQAAAKSLGLASGKQGERVRFTGEQVNRLAAALGVTPPVAGLTRAESLVLAVLSRRPLGLVSHRAVARACSLSPATAVKAVGSLQGKGLVAVEREVRALGRAQEVTVIRANNLHPDWSRLLDQLQHVHPPVSQEGGAVRLPSYLRHAFWNVDDTTYKRLDIHENGAYIADRALTTDDPNLLAFAAAHLDADAWEGAARARGRSARGKRLADNLARNASRG
ncbi:MAG: MarR family transcriptional regulator [Actinomycetes bacterium]